MSATWTLKRVRAGAIDETRSLRNWNIRTASISLVSLGRDTMRLVQGQNLDDEDDFKNGDILRLYRNETQAFMGQVLRPVYGASARIESRTIIVAGPWWWAETEPCVDTWRGNPGLQLITKIGKTLIFIEKNGNFRPIGGEVGRLVDDLIATGAPWSKGIIDSRGLPPPRELENVTYSEVLQMVIESVPDITGWFDYSTSSPTFHLRDPDHLEAIDITIGGKVPVGQPQFEELLEIGRHDDDAVPFVEIQIKKKEPIEVIFNGTEEPRYRSDYAKYRFPAAMTGRGGVIVLLAETDPLKSWDALAFAQRAYEAFAGMLWRGSFTMIGDDINSALRPGLRVNLLGGRAEWRDMNGLVQQVQHDIFGGRTSVTFGPPLQLTPSNLVQKLIALRRQKQVTNDDLSDQDNGYTAGFDEEANDAVGFPVKAILNTMQEGGSFENMLVTFPKKARAQLPP
jgi:hypothetical protein